MSLRIPENEVPAVLGVLKQTAFRYTFAKSLQVISATIFFYYCVLRFEEEKEYIWSRKWTWGKIMYIITRYSGAVFNIIVCVSIFSLPWNGYDDRNESFNWSLCILGYLYTGLGVWPILFAEVILEMRVYAVYRKRKAVLVSMIILSIISLGVDFIQGFGILYLATSVICFGNCDELARPSSESVLLASDVVVSCTSNSLPMSALGWLILSVVELILFVMILRKTRNDKKRGLVSRSTSNADIVTVIANDSTSYFVIIFTASVIGTCLSFVAEVQSNDSPAIIFIGTQLNAYQTIVVTIVTLLAPRLLISLRREVYTHTPRVDLGTAVVPNGANIQLDQQELTWDVRRPYTQDDNFELSEINSETVWSKGGQYHTLPEDETLVAAETLQQRRKIPVATEGGYTHVRSLSDFEARSAGDVAAYSDSSESNNERTVHTTLL